MRIVTKPVVACDWGHGSKCMFAHSDKTEAYKAGLIAFMRNHPGSIIPIECTFESFFVDQREEILRVEKETDCELWAMSTRITSNRRIDRGLRKADKGDAELIRALFLEGVVDFKRARLLGTEKDKRLNSIRDAAAHVVIASRKLEYDNEECARAEEFLGEPPTEGPLFETMTRNKRDIRWQESAAFPVAIYALAALEAGEEREFFESLVGFHGDGYPNVVRSNLYRLAENLTKPLLPQIVLEERKEDAARYAAKEEAVKNLRKQKKEALAGKKTAAEKKIIRKEWDEKIEAKEQTYVARARSEEELRLRKEIQNKVHQAMRQIWTRVRAKFKANRPRAIPDSGIEYAVA